MKIPFCSLAKSKFNSYSFSSNLATKATTPKEKSKITLKESDLMYLFKKCSNARDVTQLHAQIIRSGQNQTLFVIGKIIVFCAVSEQGDMGYAASVFENIESPDGFLWNTMIRGFSKNCKPVKAFEYYKIMQENGFLSDNFTLSFLLKACGQLGSVVLGQQMHCSALKHGLDSHEFVRSALIHMYGMVTDIETASQLFEEIPEPELVAWNIIIDCHVGCGKYKEALNLFLRMFASGIEPDEATILVTLSACSALAALDSGRWVHSCVDGTRLNGITTVSNSLINMYAKCGAVEEACELFNKMKGKNIISWNTMILALATHGHAKEALALFEKMFRDNLERPDDVTFLGVLCACSHGGMVDEGRRYFDIMCKEYHIKPTIRHYGCMVDILSRAGFVEEAYQLIRSMPMESNAIVWRTQLAACQLHGKVELGEKAWRYLSELEPDHSSDYVVLANMYASAGQWNEVQRVRKSMQDMGIQKSEPGKSFIGTALDKRSDLGSVETCPHQGRQ